MKLESVELGDLGVNKRTNKQIAELENLDYQTNKISNNLTLITKQ